MTRLPLLAGGLALLLLLTTAPAHAQEWRQEVQIISPIQFGEPLYVFVDSLARVLDRNPETRVRRSADAAPQPFREVRESLYDDGVDVRSASHAFVRYRFDLTDQGSGIIETMEDIFLIFRLDESREDLPILHLSTRSPLVSRLLTDNGIPSPVNMMALTPFRQLMSFPVVTARQETAVVEFGRRAVRNNEVPQQTSLLHLIGDHMSLGTYDLATSHQQVAALATP
jgi:hypothetical protein